MAHAHPGDMAMTWNYRIVKYADGSGYGLHEVFYDENGAATNMTKEPVDFTGEVRSDVVMALQSATRDAYYKEIFEEPAGWSEKDAKRSDQDQDEGDG